MSLLASRPNKAANRRRKPVYSTFHHHFSGRLRRPSIRRNHENVRRESAWRRHSSAARRHLRRHPENCKHKNGGTSTATVVDIPSGAEAGAEVGIELQKPSPRFRRGAFPPEDWSTRSPEAKRFEG